MHLILWLDLQGLAQVDIVATPEECEVAHRFWKAVQPFAEEFGAKVRHLGRRQRDTGSEEIESE